MRAAPQYLGRAGDRVVRDRLGQYQRYAALASEQEAALASEDLERFEEVAEALAELRAEIGTVEESEIVLGDEVSSREASMALAEAMATNRRIQLRLAALKRDNATLIRRLNRRAPEARQYLADGDRTTVTHLDVKL